MACSLDFSGCSYRIKCSYKTIHYYSLPITTPKVVNNSMVAIFVEIIVSKLSLQVIKLI